MSLTVTLNVRVEPPAAVHVTGVAETPNVLPEAGTQVTVNAVAPCVAVGAKLATAPVGPVASTTTFATFAHTTGTHAPATQLPSHGVDVTSGNVNVSVSNFEGSLRTSAVVCVAATVTVRLLVASTVSDVPADCATPFTVHA